MTLTGPSYECHVYIAMFSLKRYSEDQSHHIYRRVQTACLPESDFDSSSVMMKKLRHPRMSFVSVRHHEG
jgi:hypothetical protein